MAVSLSNARVAGAEVNSRQLTFEPGKIEATDLDIDIGTAGSTGLVLQTIHLPIAMRTHREVRVELRGGTFNPKAPAFTFLNETWRVYLGSIGFDLGLAMPQAGFYPRGGGSLVSVIAPGLPTAHQGTTRGDLIRIKGLAGVSNLPTNIADRMISRASLIFAERTEFGRAVISFEKVRWPSPGPGAAFTLIAEHQGNVPATFIGFGEKGKPAEDVADEAIGELLAFGKPSRTRLQMRISPISCSSLSPWPKAKAPTLSQPSPSIYERTLRRSRPSSTAQSRSRKEIAPDIQAL